jgi:glutaminyl-tRNA synthetase
VRLFNHLFLSENPGEEKDDSGYRLNPDSLEVLSSCLVEPGLAEAVPSLRFQFLRQGYFALDPVDSSPGNLVFNRIVSLRDSWAKAQKS